MADKIDQLKVKDAQGNDVLFDIDLPPDATPSISGLTVTGNVSDGTTTKTMTELLAGGGGSGSGVTLDTAQTITGAKTFSPSSGKTLFESGSFGIYRGDPSDGEIITFSMSHVTADLSLPNVSGTLALTSDIPSSTKLYLHTLYFLNEDKWGPAYIYIITTKATSLTWTTSGSSGYYTLPNILSCFLEGYKFGSGGGYQGIVEKSSTGSSIKLNKIYYIYNSNISSDEISNFYDYFVSETITAL